MKRIGRLRPPTIMTEPKAEKNKEALSKQSDRPQKDPGKGAISPTAAGQAPAQEPPPQGVFHSKPPFPPQAKPSLSDKEVESLLGKAALAEKHWDQLLRLQADFDNFRKRIAREKEENAGIAAETALKKLLPVIDDFERALPSTAKPDSPATLEGLRLVLNKFRAVLVDLGLQEISAAGQPFDPHLHEAVMQTYSDMQPEGIVVEETRKGYRLGPRLLRPASVIISKGKPPAAGK